MNQNGLPIGFISVADAIKLIESDTRSNAVVDTSFLVENLTHLRVDGNYNIKKLKRNKAGRIVDNGNEFVHINSEYERAMLEHAILEHYRLTAGQAIDPETIGIKRLSTAVDDEKNPQGRITVNKSSKTKVGDVIVSGEKREG